MKRIEFNEDAKSKLMSGVKILNDAVSSTLGAKGKNVIFSSGDRHYVTKDGVTVAGQVESNDEIEQAAIDIVREAAKRTAKEAGDGTTTATIIAASLIEKSLSIGLGANPMDVKRGIDRAVTIALEYVNEIKKDVKDNQTLYNIAKISANNDDFIGQMVADIFEDVGKSGAIRIEETQASQTSYETIKGCQLLTGMLSPQFANNKSKGVADYKNPYIFITDKSFETSFDELVPVLNMVIEKMKEDDEEHPLLIMCGNMEGEPLGTLAINRIKKNLPVVVVRAPEYGEYREEALDDLAAITGATFISEARGGNLKDITIDDLGTADRIVVDKEYTTIFGRHGDAKDIVERVEYVESQLEDDEGDQEWRLNKRKAMLTSGIGIVYVGGRSEQEMKEAFYRFEDSISAVKATLEDGYVTGGGISYLRIQSHLKYKIGELAITMRSDEAIGFRMLQESMSDPLHTMAENCGESGDVILDRVLTSELGYNALTGKMENLDDAGIIDPAKVVKSAISNAASVAGMIITTSCVIVNQKNKK